MKEQKRLSRVLADVAEKVGIVGIFIVVFLIGYFVCVG